MIDNITGTSTTNLPDVITTKKDIVGKDDFLKLLTYQLKAQNPMKPYDNQEFAAQLAQFSQLEQLIDIKKLIEEQSNVNNLLTQTISNSALPGMLGKYAMGMTNTVTYNGQESINFAYDNPSNAVSGLLEIKDDSGNTISTIELSEEQLKKGNQYFEWDGKDESGNVVPNANYTISVDLKDGFGNSYTPDTYVKGKIESVRFKAEGTMLVINGMEIPLNKISDISTEN